MPNFNAPTALLSKKGENSMRWPEKSFEYEARESVRSPSNEFIALVTFFAFREDGMPKVQLVELMPARKILANVCLG